MKTKRSRWISLALLGMILGLGVFYFLSDAKRWPWIGVPEEQPFGSYEEEPAAPGAGPAAARGPGGKELVRNQSDSAIHGEVGLVMSFGASNLPDEQNRRPVDVDPALLDAIGDTLLATFDPVCDSLLGIVGAPFQKLNAFGQLLPGSQNPLAETNQTATKLVERIAPAQSVPIAESRLQNLIREAQTARDASSRNAAEVERGAERLSSTQVVSPRPGSPSFGSSGASTLSNTTGVTRSAFSSLPRR